ERLRRLLLQQDRLQTEIDKELNDTGTIRSLHKELEGINRQIAVILVETRHDLNSEEESETTKKIKALQELRKKKQQEIGQLKADMRKGEGAYEEARVSREMREAEMKMYGLVVSADMEDAVLDEQLAAARAEISICADFEFWLRQLIQQKFQAVQKKERARAKIDDRIYRMVRKLHLEAVDLLSRFHVVYLPKFDVKGMVKTTGNLGPMSKRILLRLRPAKFLGRLQRRMSLGGGGIFQPDESMTTQFRPLTGECRSPGRKKVIKDVVILNGFKYRVRTLRDTYEPEELNQKSFEKYKTTKTLLPNIDVFERLKLNPVTQYKVQLSTMGFL
ncbi:hypothetical protein HDU96_011112, partial [Phlyctochytrium bullatum]